MIKKQSGFTLIEIMVALSIIAILLTIALVSFSDVRAKNRDDQRIADVAEYQLALRLYYEQNDAYPDYPDGVELGVGNPIDALLDPYLPGLPADPSGVSEYWFDSAYSCNGTVGPVIYTTSMELTGNSNAATSC